MKKQFAKFALGIIGALAVAAPAFPSTVLNFNFDSGSTSGTVSGTGSGTTGNFSVDDVAESGGVVSNWPQSLPGGPTTLLFKISFGGGDLTIQSLAASGCNPCGGSSKPLTDLGTLYSAPTTLTGGVTGSSLLETVSGTWTNVNATFLSELGLAAGTTFTIAGQISGSSTAVTSDTLTLTAIAPTPEPASIFLLGAGLLTFAVILRKRQIRNT
jgi:hypothetical protein